MSNDIRARIMQFHAIPEPVELPDLGTVYVRRITLGELDSIRKETPETKDVGMPVRLLAAFMGDDKGVAIFNAAKAEDVAALNALPVSAAAEILKRGNKANSLGDDEKKT